MEAWEKILGELVRKSWTACRYPAETDLACSSGESVVVFSDEDIWTMVEKLYGPGVHTDFDDEELC